MAIVNGTPFDDILNGTVGDDQLFGLGGNDILNGGRGQDRLDGGLGADTMNGGLGNDTYVVDNSGDVVIDPDGVFPFFFSGGIDTVESSITSYTLGATIENLTLTGLAAIQGAGNARNNILTGNSANNLLFGLDGNDTLNGGGGNDVLDGGLGADLLNGGLGTDTASYGFTNNVIMGVTVNLGLAGAQNTVGAGLDTLVSIENLAGSFFNDTLFGNGGNNVLSGLGGNDQLRGGDGHDWLFGSFDNDRLFGELGNDALDGGSGNDMLNGGNGNDVLFGEEGNDQLFGGNGDDELFDNSGNDVLNGGVGTDTAFYSAATAGVRVNLALAGAQDTGGGGVDTLSSIEQLVGSDFNDTLTGNADNNTLVGSFGQDQLNGGLGNDLFYYEGVNESPAGAGRDKIVGFAGNGALVGDQIDLRDIDANGLVPGDQIFIWGGSFTAGHLRYVGGVLQGNTDGDAAAEFEIQLVGAPVLSVGGVGTDILL